jgi:ribosomal protein S12 methylthiotransferase accessory factor
MPLLRDRFGITRVGDTTQLDRTGVPTFCAIVPKSPDVLGVYNGKGRTLLAARVSAVMEAFERQAAATVSFDSFQRSVSKLNESLHLEQLELLPDALDLEAECVEAYDLITEETVAVPCCLVRFPWRGTRLFARSSTNGLASGNNVVEATYHALTEMVERHVWSLFHVRSEVVPQFYRGSDAPDTVAASVLTFPTGDDPVDSMHAAISSTGLQVRVMILSEGSLPHVAFVTIIEPRSEPPMAHLGVGCSLSPAHAIERALSEGIQSRVVDVQAAREDIMLPDEPANGRGTHARRLRSLPKGRWFVDLPARNVTLRDLIDESTDDVSKDVQVVVSKLRDHGIRRAAVVDISPPNQPLSVVRIVGPDFETTAVDGRIGPIALDEFNPFKSRYISPRRSEIV